MKKGAKRFLSFALASTLMAGLPAVAHASDNNTETVVYEDTMLDTTNYIVKEGDTLGKIAEKFYGNAAYWEFLAEYNNMDTPSMIYPGQIVTIPRQLVVPYVESQEATVVEAYEADRTYTVQKGDTLYCIVRVQYGLTNQEAVDKLATYNNLSDPNRLSVGQVLLIPCVEKLLAVVQRDYSNEYNQQAMREQCKPCRPCQPCQPSPCQPNPCQQYIIIPVCPNTVVEPGCALILKP